MRKLKAFTLLELLIAMIISSIVITFGYGVYSLIYKQYLSYKNAKSEVVNILQCNTIINNDFNDSEEITLDKNTIVITGKNSEPLTYIFNDIYILRKKSEITDTFKIVASNFQEKFVFGNELIKPTLINELSFDVQLAGEKQHFIFFKKYSAATLFSKEMEFQQAE